MRLPGESTSPPDGRTPLHYANPVWPDTRGSWVKIGANHCRIPQNSIATIIRARDGREFGVIAGTNALDGKLWVLADTPHGIRELRGLPVGLRSDLRREAFAPR
ncbi:hypothetical protein ACFV3I_18245 [Microbacterium sp. NPDC059771]|uniref:hypothetical protein n=1 Tax=Microbacterium sp. NPDC059771 TaxID=3346941 RepID=UPI00366920A9